MNNGINFEAVQEEINRLDDQYKKAETETENQEPYNENQTGRTFDVQKMVKALENIGNEFIGQKLHNELKFSDDDIELHSEMLTFVLEKHFSIDALRNTPEMMLAGHTVIMAISFQKKFNELRAAGEIK